MLFRREKNILVVATKFKVAANIVIKVKKMLNSIPEWLRIADIKIDNQTAFELTNGSIIKASTTSVNDARVVQNLFLFLLLTKQHTLKIWIQCGWQLSQHWLCGRQMCCSFIS